MALEHEGGLYRADWLDDVLGSPLPDDLLPLAASFRRRVFAMGMAGLDNHAFELADGTRLDDCKLPSPPDRWLPPCGEDPALFELPPEATLPLRLESRALRGHDADAPSLGRPLRVSAALALILTEDLRLPSIDEARGALGGACLALCWVDPQLDAQARREGLGPGPGRSPGTHLGPWLGTDPLPARVELALAAAGRSVQKVTVVEPIKRAAEAVRVLGQRLDLKAGDAVLVAAAGHAEVRPGEQVAMRGPGLGELWGWSG